MLLTRMLMQRLPFALIISSLLKNTETMIDINTEHIIFDPYGLRATMFNWVLNLLTKL